MGRRVFVLLMCALITLPALLLPFSHGEKTEGTGAERLASFADQNIGFKEPLIRLNAALIGALQDSSSPQVILGREGWLFFEKTASDYLGQSRMTEAELDELAARLSALSDSLLKVGTELIVLIAPNKNSVYGEYMPLRFGKARRGNLEALQAALLEKEVTMLDTRSLLRNQKPRGQLYFKEDTHWNARGAYLTSCALLEMMQIQPPAEPAYEEGRARDLAALLSPLSIGETEADAAPQAERTYAFKRPMRSLDDMKIETRNQAGRHSVLVLRDSFGEMLFPYLAGAFKEMTYSRVYDGALSQARAAKADYAVLLIAERNLKNLLSYALNE